MRLTTDAPIDYLLEETAFKVTEPIHLILGPDETLPEGPAEIAETFLKNTTNYWRAWTHRLAVPLEWQEAVIRAAITLKMCAYEPTGAIVAAMTTSIPEAPNSARNWDYRYCWVRDAFFVVRALNSLAAVRTLENYFRWIMNIVDDVHAGHIQPVFGITLERKLTERTIEHLPGYRGMGPVRVGNQAYEHFQHDTYGNLILAAAPAFFDTRLFMTPGARNSPSSNHRRARLPALRQARRRHLGAALARAHAHLVEPDVLGGLRPPGQDRGPSGRRGADAVLGRRAPPRSATPSWRAPGRSSARPSSKASTAPTLDASVLLMSEVGFIEPDDPRFVQTVERIQEVLGTGPHLMRYEDADDFGKPETAFNVCAFWHLDALARIGRRDEAREKFEELLRARNHLGLMSEDTDPQSGEAWGNFPQTYSMVGIINGAIRLSRSWETVV